MRDTQQVRDWLRDQRGRRGAIAKELCISPKTLERIVHEPGYYPRADTLEKIDRFISSKGGDGSAPADSTQEAKP